jgi:hypothetical protein
MCGAKVKTDKLIDKREKEKIATPLGWVHGTSGQCRRDSLSICKK